MYLQSYTFWPKINRKKTLDMSTATELVHASKPTIHASELASVFAQTARFG